MISDGSLTTGSFRCPDILTFLPFPTVPLCHLFYVEPLVTTSGAPGTHNVNAGDILVSDLSLLGDLSSPEATRTARGKEVSRRLAPYVLEVLTFSAFRESVVPVLSSPSFGPDLTSRIA